MSCPIWSSGCWCPQVSTAGGKTSNYQGFLGVYYLCSLTLSLYVLLQCLCFLWRPVSVLFCSKNLELRGIPKSCHDFPYVCVLAEGCPGLCNSNGRCALDQNGWHCVCQPGWRGAGCDVAMETLCTDSKDNEGGKIKFPLLFFFISIYFWWEYDILSAHLIVIWNGFLPNWNLLFFQLHSNLSRHYDVGFWWPFFQFKTDA